MACGLPHKNIPYRATSVTNKLVKNYAQLSVSDSNQTAFIREIFNCEVMLTLREGK